VDVWRKNGLADVLHLYRQRDVGVRVHPVRTKVVALRGSSNARLEPTGGVGEVRPLGGKGAVDVVDVLCGAARALQVLMEDHHAAAMHGERHRSAEHGKDAGGEVGEDHEQEFFREWDFVDGHLRNDYEGVRVEERGMRRRTEPTEGWMSVVRGIATGNLIGLEGYDPAESIE
jgi:hypothetical protein